MRGAEVSRSASSDESIEPQASARRLPTPAPNEKLNRRVEFRGSRRCILGRTHLVVHSSEQDAACEDHQPSCGAYVACIFTCSPRVFSSLPPPPDQSPGIRLTTYPGVRRVGAPQHRHLDPSERLVSMSLHHYGPHRRPSPAGRRSVVSSQYRRPSCGLAIA